MASSYLLLTLSSSLSFLFYGPGFPTLVPTETLLLKTIWIMNRLNQYNYLDQVKRSIAAKRPHIFVSIPIVLHKLIFPHQRFYFSLHKMSLKQAHLVSYYIRRFYTALQLISFSFLLFLCTSSTIFPHSKDKLSSCSKKKEKNCGGFPSDFLVPISEAC